MREADHTVSVPMEDYIEMKKAMDSINEIKENIDAHRLVLFSLTKIMVDIDINKRPVDARLVQDNYVRRVDFRYP